MHNEKIYAKRIDWVFFFVYAKRMDKQNHAAEFAAIRRNLGMSQQQMGAELGVHQTTVMRWEKGIQPIRRVFLIAARKLTIDRDAA